MLSLAVSSATELEMEPSDLALNMRSPPPAADDMRLLELMISLAERMEPPIMGKSGFVPEDVPTDALWLLDRAHTILTLIGSSCNMRMMVPEARYIFKIRVRLPIYRVSRLLPNLGWVDLASLI